MVKLKVREKSISYAAYHKSATTKRENELQNTITILQKQLDMAKNNEPKNQSIIERINLLKRDLEKIIEHRTKGAILRSKSQWYNEGERNTKYFLNLEKRHFKQGTISQLRQISSLATKQSYLNVNLSTNTFKPPKSTMTSLRSSFNQRTKLS